MVVATIKEISTSSGNSRGYILYCKLELKAITMHTIISLWALLKDAVLVGGGVEVITAALRINCRPRTNSSRLTYPTLSLSKWLRRASNSCDNIKAAITIAQNYWEYNLLIFPGDLPWHACITEKWLPCQFYQCDRLTLRLPWSWMLHHHLSVVTVEERVLWYGSKHFITIYKPQCDN